MCELKDLVDSRFLRSFVKIISSSMEGIDTKVKEKACDKEESRKSQKFVTGSIQPIGWSPQPNRLD